MAPPSCWDRTCCWRCCERLAVEVTLSTRTLKITKHHDEMCPQTRIRNELREISFPGLQTGVGGNNEGAFLLKSLRRLTWSLSSWQHPESETQPPRCQSSNYPPSIFTRRRWRNWSVCLCPTSCLTIATQKIKLQHFPSECEYSRHLKIKSNPRH